VVTVELQERSRRRPVLVLSSRPALPLWRGGRVDDVALIARGGGCQKLRPVAAVPVLCGCRCVPCQ